jgi:hypothetical protein
MTQIEGAPVAGRFESTTDGSHRGTRRLRRRAIAVKEGYKAFP